MNKLKQSLNKYLDDNYMIPEDIIIGFLFVGMPIVLISIVVVKQRRDFLFTFKIIYELFLDILIKILSIAQHIGRQIKGRRFQTFPRQKINQVGRNKFILYQKCTIIQNHKNYLFQPVNQWKVTTIESKYDFELTQIFNPSALFIYKQMPIDISRIRKILKGEMLIDLFAQNATQRQIIQSLIDLNKTYSLQERIMLINQYIKLLDIDSELIFILFDNKLRNYQMDDLF